MTVSTGKFGIHLMLDGYGAPANTLADRRRLRNLLVRIPTDLGMHLICEPKVVEVGPKNRKDPGGVSGFVMIAESHFSFHTFPARGFATLDLYTCQDTMDCGRVIGLLTDAFGFESVDAFVQDRGLRYPVDDIYGRDCLRGRSAEAAEGPTLSH